MVARCTSLTLFWLVLLLSSINGSLQAQTSKANIKLHLDSSEIFIGDAVVLEVESTGLLDPIDLTPLESNTTIIRETTGTRIAVIGGKVVEIAIRRMDLIPKRPGLLVIGPLIAGDIVSNSVHIKVLDATRPTWQPQQEDLKINTSLDPQSPWINQQTVLTIELLHRYPISNESIQLPNLSGFSKRLIIDKRRTFKDTDKEWYRTEWQYLIFPTRSGNLSIGDIQWSGTVAKSRIERAEFKRSQSTVSLQVRAAANKQDHWWLPGSDLKLTEQWSTPVTGLRAGDELQRRIIVQATGILAEQIPTPKVPESRALQQTLINSSRNENINGRRIVSTAEFTYRVKAQSPIPVFLDTVRMHWWDTKTDEPLVAIVPARRINVGLPDRSDLLTKIALQETGVTRLKHWLQSAGWLRVVLFLAGIISFLIIAWALLPLLLNQLFRHWQKRQCLRTMRAIALRGDAMALYRLLKKTDTHEILGGTETDLVNQLQHQLFATHPSSPTAASLVHLVNVTGAKQISQKESSQGTQHHRNRGDSLANL